ncbi:MAG: hypothetical protein B6I28_00200 [Fusobacteriia bacterium 4572_132]|nr:MAG: hypothetical protein B6I28_00200 [Fusobacteriia bacterium 4572_132]
MMDQAAKLRELVKERESRDKKAKKKNKAEIIAITSGKGGVGKTSLAVNMAAILQKKSKKVLIIDADLGLSNVEIMLGVTPSYTMKDLIKNNKSIEEIIIKGPYKIDFISGGNGFLEITELSNIEREEIFIKLKKLDELYDIIIIDTGAGISKNVISFLEIADQILVVATSEPTSLTDAYSIIKVINEKNNKIEIGVIINRAINIAEYKKAADIIINTSFKFLNKKISKLGFIYEDKVVRETIYKKAPFAIYYPNSKATSCMNYIIEKVIKEKSEIKRNETILDRMKNWLNPIGR